MTGMRSQALRDTGAMRQEKLSKLRRIEVAHAGGLEER